MYNTVVKSYISFNPKIFGGKPVITGTRIPVSRILFLLRDGYTIEAIHEEYPHVDVQTLKGAVDEAVRLIDNNQNASLS